MRIPGNGRHLPEPTQDQAETQGRDAIGNSRDGFFVRDALSTIANAVSSTMETVLSAVQKPGVNVSGHFEIRQKPVTVIKSEATIKVEAEGDDAAAVQAAVAKKVEEVKKAHRLALDQLKLVAADTIGGAGRVSVTLHYS